MTTLPSEDAVGPLPDRLPRRSGVGGWQPDIISRDTAQAGQGLESLGAGIGHLADAEQNKQNQLGLANADSAVSVAAIQHGQQLKNTTDGSQTGDISDSFDNTVNTIAQTLPENQRPLFIAKHAPTVAQFGENADTRGKELDGQKAVANFGTLRDTTINAAAGIDDDAASGRAILTIGPQIDAMQNAGYVNAEQAQRMKQQAVRDYTGARYAVIKQQAEATGDWTRLERFIESNPFQGVDYSQPGQPQGPVNMAIPPEGRALIATIYGPESGGGYNRRYSPQGNATFNGFADHPRQAEVIPEGQPNAGKTSDAAGAGQFLSSTWDMEAKKLGLKDFSPSSQDAATWDLAQTTYKQQTGGDLLTALKSNDPRVIAGVSDALKGQWSSLPGGVQPGTTTSKFVNQFQNNLQTTATQHGGGAFVGLPPPNQVAGPGAPSGINDSVNYSWNDKTQKFDIPSGQGQGGRPGDKLAPPVYDSAGNPIPPPDQTNFNAANTAMKLTPQEQALYQRHLTNLNGPGGVHNADGSISTLYQSSVEVNGRTYNIPTVYDGKILSPADALARAKAEGIDKFPSYPDEDTAEARYNQMHGFMEKDTGDYLAAQKAGQTGSSPANLSLVPPKSQWPDGTDHVAANKDGTLSYVAQDGTTTPVPGSHPTGAPGLPAPQRPGGSVLDFLDPQEHARILLEAQQTINSLQKQAYAAQKQDVGQAIKAMDHVQATIVSGNPVSDTIFNTYRQQAAQSQEPEIRERFAALDAVRNTITSFKGEAPSFVAGAVSKLQADYTASVNGDPNNPLNPIKGEALAAAQKYLDQYQKDIQKDPNERAVKEGFLPKGLTPVNPNDPNIEQAITQRVADAQTAAQALGLSEPKYLNQSEKLALRQLSIAGKQPMVDFATHLVNAAGENTGSILKEIGAGAPDLEAVGRLAAVGGDPGAIDTLARVSAAERDPEAKKTVPKFGPSFLQGLAIPNPVGTAAGSLGPDGQARLNSTAYKLMTGDAMDAGKDPKEDKGDDFFGQDFVNRAYTRALGGSIDKNNVQWGGLADRGGSSFFSPSSWGTGATQKVIVPTNMKASEFNNVVNSLTDNDLNLLPSQPYSAGRAMSAQEIKDGQIYALPDAKSGNIDGLYGVKINGKRVDDQTGKPWVIDMKGLEPTLRNRFPEAYQGGKNPPVAPVAPYRQTHGVGMIASAETPQAQPPTEE